MLVQSFIISSRTTWELKPETGLTYVRGVGDVFRSAGPPLENVGFGGGEALRRVRSLGPKQCSLLGSYNLKFFIHIHFPSHGIS